MASNLNKFGAGGSSKRGFSLIELLVVIAITAVLLLILFIPLQRSIELSQRAKARIAGHDNVRNAMARINRDLKNAMMVYEPRDLAIWGFSAWQPYGADRARPAPAGTAVPERYIVRNGMIVFRPAKTRYFNVVRGRYVTPEDIDLVVPPPRVSDDIVALATDPRFPGEPVELRPVQPLTPVDYLVAYFVGLKDPTRVDGGGRPVYDNIALWGRTFLPQNPNTLNTYVLYRVEFDPNDPRFSNWQSPDFFYDQTPVTVGATTAPRAAWWRDEAQAVMDAETADVVRWVETVGGKRVPHSMVSFAPSATIEEVAQPNRTPGQYLLDGTTQPAEIPSTEYTTAEGNWIGFQPYQVAYGKLVPLDPTVLVSPTPLAGGQLGPRIQVFDPSEPNPALRIKFDSETANRQRLLTYDPLAGRVEFGIERLDPSQPPNAANPLQRLLREHFDATVNTTNYTATLLGDTTGAGAIPLSFGAAATVATLQPTLRIVPGSEAVQLYDENLGESRPMRRAGWTGLVGGLNRFVAQADLESDEYAIDYSTGEITLADRDPSLWTQVGPGGPIHLLVRYRFQTNLPTDVVRVTYASRELLAVNIGIVNYTRGNQELLPFEVSQRVAVGNLKR